VGHRDQDVSSPPATTAGPMIPPSRTSCRPSPPTAAPSPTAPSCWRVRLRRTGRC
jgi:hypothetical protein